MSADLEFSIRRRLGSGFELNAEATLPMPGGSFTVMLGSSGSGKTTILRALAGLDHPDRGRIRMADTVWFDDERGIRLPPQRRGAGLVPQEGAVFPHLDVEANVGFGITGLAPSARRERIRSMLRLTRLDGLDRRRPDQLSGGQRQRVALARSLAVNPKLLLLDEPFTALDPPTRRSVRDDCRRLLGDLGVPALMVTHDRDEALALADRIIVIDQGRVLQAGTVADVFGRPADPRVAGLVDFGRLIPGVIRGVDDGVARIGCGSAELVALIEPGSILEAEPTSESRPCFVGIAPEDVALQREPPVATSVRNRLPATVSAVRAEGRLLLIELDAGLPLMAAVTRASAMELGLEPGSSIHALIKASAIHLLPRREG